MLKNMNKAAAVNEYLRGIQWLKKYDILAYGSFIIGFPGETGQSIRDTIKFIKESGIDFYRAQSWYCAPGTPVWAKRDIYDIRGESFEWSHATMDSKEAAGRVEEIFLSIEEPIWIPQYNFECDGLFHLMHRGFTLDQVKAFIKGFNRGVKEKLTNPAQNEVSFDVLQQIKDACPDIPLEEEKNSLNTYDAGFDF